MAAIVVSGVAIIVITVSFTSYCCDAFSFVPRKHHHHYYNNNNGLSSSSSSLLLLMTSTNNVENNNKEESDVDPGRIRGCHLIQLDEKSLSDWEIEIDGEEADLGKFSESIYKQVLTNAKQEQFQGFRPGTIPPHLQPTYIAFTMDECAREATLEAMTQNNIRPFENARQLFLFRKISIPSPPLIKNKKKKKKKKSNKKQNKQLLIKEDNEENDEEKNAVNMEEKEKVDTEPQWQTFETMKEAIDAGWKPGQSFSFLATNVKGQQIPDEEKNRDAIPIGERSTVSTFDIDSIP